HPIGCLKWLRGSRDFRFDDRLSLKQKRHPKFTRQNTPKPAHRQFPANRGESAVTMLNIKLHRPLTVSEHLPRESLVLSATEIDHAVVEKTPTRLHGIPPAPASVLRMTASQSGPQRKPPRRAMGIKVVREGHENVRFARQVPLSGKRMHSDAIGLQHAPDFLQ